MPSVAAARPRVKQTSATTGTGAYTLVAAETGFANLSDAVTPGSTALIYCTVTMGAEFEEGVYTLSASSTLARTKINRSSNSNNAVNWGAGDKMIVQGPSVSSAIQGKHSFDGTVYPFGSSETAAASGWGPGSMAFLYDEWDSNPQLQSGRLWICRNAEHAAGIGNWLGVVTANNYGAYDGKLINYSTDAVQRDSHSLGPSMDFAHPSITVECVFGMGWGGLAAWNSMIFAGHGWGTDIGEYETVLNVGFYLETTDATPTKVINGTNSGNNERTYLPIPLNSVHRFRGTVTALATVATGGDCSCWDVVFTVKRAGSGDPAFVGAADVTMTEQDAGAAAWGVTVGIDTTNDGVYLEVTGEAGTTIRWTVSLAATKTAFT